MLHSIYVNTFYIMYFWHNVPFDIMTPDVHTHLTKRPFNVQTNTVLHMRGSVGE